MCYIEVGLDGAVTWGDVTGADERASRGQSQLYAVWPGEWASHLFEIDDLDEFLRAFGFIHDKSRTGLADHQHEVWWRSGTRDPNPERNVGVHRSTTDLRVRDQGHQGVGRPDS
jgi:hypothetical protein